MNMIDTSLDAADDVRTPSCVAGANATAGPAGSRAALGAADWLSLAAAPTFAIMALIAGVHGGGGPDLLCSAAHEASPLAGMAPMYVLMSAFHVAPWLKLMRLPERRRLAPVGAAASEMR
jgi:hypothetical protein